MIFEDGLVTFVFICTTPEGSIKHLWKELNASLKQVFKGIEPSQLDGWCAVVQHELSLWLH